MNELTCLRCKTPLEANAEACPNCGEKVTHFQRTYSAKLIDGKYQILERLGLGGMGEIFKVRHIHLNEQRVIKIMRANIASDEQALQRFLHEARLATMIKHRNLAMLYDFSTLDDGSYYMVWEYIEGTNIQKWIATNGPMPGRLALEVAIQALSGLEALHQMGIIHRDISPENIMLSQDHRGQLLIKVIDFGIAKQLDDGGVGHGLTQTGMFLGKLKYASPEQAGFLKEDEHMDARSDLYSFGVVFYEMLAGRAPFIATNPNAYLLKHATEKPAPIAQLAPGVEVYPKLEAVVQRALEKDRDLRQANAAELIAELEALRTEIKPDAKYGLGERLTISSRTTAVDTGRPTAPGTTRPGTAPTALRGTPTPSPTRSGSTDATVVEKKPTAAQLEPTMADRPMGATAAQRTVQETISEVATPTAVERKLAPAAESTLMERLPQKSKAPLWIAVAAVVVIAIAAGLYFTRSKPEPVKPDGGPDIVTTTQPSTEITSTALPELKPGEGVVRLSGFGRELKTIHNLKTNKEVAVTLEDKLTPLYVNLPEGMYRLILKDETGREYTQDVKVLANAVQPVDWTGGNEINYDELAQEILAK